MRAASSFGELRGGKRARHRAGSLAGQLIQTSNGREEMTWEGGVDGGGRGMGLAGWVGGQEGSWPMGLEDATEEVRARKNGQISEHEARGVEHEDLVVVL